MVVVVGVVVAGVGAGAGAGAGADPSPPSAGGVSPPSPPPSAGVSTSDVVLVGASTPPAPASVSVEFVSSANVIWFVKIVRKVEIRMTE